MQVPASGLVRPACTFTREILRAPETLEPAVVNGTCRMVRDLATEVGAGVEIGLTTGEWIVPDWPIGSR